MLKTHTCGELRSEDVGKEVVLAGWLNRRRDHGGLVFLDLHDRFGITQVTINSDEQPAAHASASIPRSEYVIQVKGIVKLRQKGSRTLISPPAPLRSWRLRSISSRIAHAAFLYQRVEEQTMLTKHCASSTVTWTCDGHGWRRI